MSDITAVLLMVTDCILFRIFFKYQKDHEEHGMVGTYSAPCMMHSTHHLIEAPYFKLRQINMPIVSEYPISIVSLEAPQKPFQG